MTLLHVISSPRKQRSASIEVANAFIDAWRSKYPEGNIDTLNVWETDLLPFDNAALDAKYAGIEGKALTAEQQDVWGQIKELADRFHCADILVFSVPMWNFGIPYRLKHLIDVISHKNVLFTFDERGLIGMLGEQTRDCCACGAAADHHGIGGLRKRRACPMRLRQRGGP